MRRDIWIFLLGNGLLSFLIILLLSSAEAKSQAFKANYPYPDFQGHRGCRGLLPENSIAGMKKAYELGVSTLEMDVVLTADSHLLLSHEPFFSHKISTAPNGAAISAAEERQYNIFRMTYAQTCLYDVGLKPHPRFPHQQRAEAKKPLLNDVIEEMERMSGGKLRYNIETKCMPLTDGIYHPAPKQFADLLVQLIKQKGIESRVTIQSFDIRTIQYVHHRYPELATILLVEANDRRTPAQQLARLGYVPFAYSPHYGLVNTELVRFCREKGMRLVPWTVNEPAVMQQLLDWGVDGLISDYPDRFRHLKPPTR